MSLQDKINSAKPTTFLTNGLSPEEVRECVEKGKERAKEIKLSVNMESYRIGLDTVKTREITEEQFHLADKGGLTEDDKMEIFGASVVWGYGLYGYEIFEEDGKYYATWRQGDTCD